MTQIISRLDAIAEPRQETGSRSPFQGGNKCTVLDAAVSVATTCDLKELSDAGLALPVQFISQRCELSGKNLLTLCSVLQDVPVVLSGLFHGGLIARL
jgi:hypothetical protein